MTFEETVERIRAEVYADVDQNQPGYGRKRVRKMLLALGFTWDHVDALRLFVPPKPGPFAEKVASAADLIEGLLPPRERS